MGNGEQVMPPTASEKAAVVDAFRRAAIRLSAIGKRDAGDVHGVNHRTTPAQASTITKRGK